MFQVSRKFSKLQNDKILWFSICTKRIQKYKTLNNFTIQRLCVEDWPNLEMDKKNRGYRWLGIVISRNLKPKLKKSNKKNMGGDSLFKLMEVDHQKDMEMNGNLYQPQIMDQVKDNQEQNEIILQNQIQNPENNNTNQSIEKRDEKIEAVAPFAPFFNPNQNLDLSLQNTREETFYFNSNNDHQNPFTFANPTKRVVDVEKSLPKKNSFDKIPNNRNEHNNQNTQKNPAPFSFDKPSKEKPSNHALMPSLLEEIRNYPLKNKNKNTQNKVNENQQNQNNNIFQLPFEDVKILTDFTENKDQEQLNKVKVTPNYQNIHIMTDEERCDDGEEDDDDEEEEEYLPEYEEIYGDEDEARDKYVPAFFTVPTPNKQNDVPIGSITNFKIPYHDDKVKLGFYSVMGQYILGEIKNFILEGWGIKIHS